jgi:hypothetical protein
VGAELVAEYVDGEMNVYPAGVAYTHPTLGYQTVNLGFGMEFMVGDRLGNGFFMSGASDRVDLMENILNYFGFLVHATDAGDASHALTTALGRARPNPFNPMTTIDYSIAAPGRVTLRVCNLAGRLVRTLVEAERRAGAYEVLWDGTTDSGDRAASGVYFVRMEAPGYRGSEKLVLLK